MSLVEYSENANATLTEADRFFGETERMSPCEDQLVKTSQFVKHFAEKLSKIEKNLCEHISSAWTFDNDVISVSVEPFVEKHSVLALVKDRTENVLFNKVITVFSFLCQEITDLQTMAETKFYGGLTMFGHGTADDDQKLEAQMGRFLVFLQDLSNFCKRVRRVTTNLVHQLACLYHQRQKLYMSTFRHVHLDGVFAKLAEAVAILATLDAIVLDNGAVAQGWDQYKKMLKYIRAEPERFGLDQERLTSFESLLVDMDKQVLSGRMFETCIQQDFDLSSSSSSSQARGLVQGNRALFEEFVYQIKNMTKQLENEFDPNASTETVWRSRLVHLVSLYCLHNKLFASTASVDKKLFKRIWAFQNHVPVVLLSGRAVWYVANFVRKHLPVQVKGLKPAAADVIKQRKSLLASQDASLEVASRRLYTQVAAWMVHMDSDLNIVPGSTKVSSMINARSKLLVNGILLANTVRNLVSTNIMLHLETNTPFRKQNIRPIATCLEMIKAIHAMYHRKSAMIATNMSHMIGLCQFILKKIITPVKKRLEATKRLDDTNLDVLSAVNLALQMLNSPPTRNHRIVMELCLAIAQMRSVLKSSELDEIRHQVWKLNLLSDWQNVIRRVCSCDFVYWALDLVPSIFKDIYAQTDQVHRLQYLLASLQDCKHLLMSVEHEDDKTQFLKQYADDLENMLTDELIQPLSRAIETDLRLHIHSVVLKQANLRRTTIKDLSQFVQLQPLRLFNKKVSLKQRVEHYLDTTFYNTNTVALHDWKVYAEMRNLAWEKYGLKLMEAHLPTSSHYSGGLDVLEIMRNIHIFVARYNYNLNTQIFVERTLDQKHINSINIQHIAASIRTHGTGVMNTTVNFTYQFLTQKFLVFSEFLYDDHIKSRLARLHRFYKEKRESLGNRFPYARAEKLIRDVRKLGTNDSGMSYLDQFRRLVTEMGNALGYVRMVRSGGLNHCSRSIKFVPDIEDIVPFEENCKTDALSGDTVSAAKNLDDVLEGLSKNFAEGTDYFHILVRVFTHVLRKNDSGHLKYFVFCVPALMVSFVERLLVMKEGLQKKSRTECTFTDDGFALGLAYILKVLDQLEAFDALHWWESVNHTLKEKHTKLKQEQAAQKGKGDEVETMALALKRVQLLRREWDMLYYSFSGARIFFKTKIGKDQQSTAPQSQQEQEGEAGAQSSEGAPAPAAAAPAPAPAPAVGGAAPPPPGAAVAAPPPATSAPTPPPPPPISTTLALAKGGDVPDAPPLP